jgi:hypothetical protein
MYNIRTNYVQRRPIIYESHDLHHKLSHMKHTMIEGCMSTEEFITCNMYGTPHA